MRFRWIGWDAVAAQAEGIKVSLALGRAASSDVQMRASNEALPNSLFFISWEWPGCPSLRASDEHCLIVRVLRARRTDWLFPPFIDSSPPPPYNAAR